MKKAIALLMTITLIVCSVPALGEVVILESPDMPKEENTGSLDDLKIGVGVDLGDRIYTPVKMKICDKVNGYYSDYDIKSGLENQVVCLWIEAMNLSTKPMDYFKDATVVLVYEGERGTYKFGGGVMQCYGYDYPDNPQYKPDKFQTIGVLRERNYVFYCIIPNYVEENPGEIRMEITTGGETMTCIIRE